MAVALFYLSQNPGEGRSEIRLRDGRLAGYVRAELTTPGSDLNDSLDQANEREDEGFMNSHEVEPK